MNRKKISRVIQYFDSHREADEADRAFYRSLSPQERIELALNLMEPIYEAYPRFERVYRTAELGECPVSGDWGVGL